MDVDALELGFVQPGEIAQTVDDFAHAAYAAGFAPVIRTRFSSKDCPMPLMPPNSPKCTARISAPSRLAAKADVVVQIDPGGYIFTQFARLPVQFVEVLARVGIGGNAGVVEDGPLGDFPWKFANQSSRPIELGQAPVVADPSQSVSLLRLDLVSEQRYPEGRE